MRPMLVPMLLALSLPWLSAQASDPAPEVKRDPAPPQALGDLRTLRTIPEACARVQGRFTDDPAQPYKFEIVRTSPSCQARAQLVDTAQAKPSTQTGWIFNDLIRVPSAACVTRQAVVRVWRHPAAAAPPKLDQQGRSRIYLKASMQNAKAGKLAPIPFYAVAMSVEGIPCKGG